MKKYQFNEEKKIPFTPRTGSICMVKLLVEVIFEWSDKIVADHDEESGETEYTSGWVMQVLPNQRFVHKGEECTLIAQAMKESDDKGQSNPH